MTFRTLLVLVPAVAALAACGNLSTALDSTQAKVPAPVKVPTGHAVSLETVGVGEITYECRVQTGAAVAHQWVFVGPQADLNSKRGAKLGSYYGPPATWASTDGSRITGKQLAVAPGATGSIPLQLVQANPAEGQGAMTGVTYIQRLNTRGGVAPAMPCDAGAVGQKQVVKYQADYIFWKAA